MLQTVRRLGSGLLLTAAVSLVSPAGAVANVGANSRQDARSLASAPGGTVLAAATPNLQGLSDLGRAGSNTRVDIAVLLKYRGQAQLEALVAAQSNRRSPLYHHWLTQAQFLASFGPLATDHARVIAALQSAGFTVTRTFANRTLIDASAPAPLAEQFFQTEIHNVLQPGRGTRYTIVRPAIMPGALTGIVHSVAGLSNVVVLHPTSHAVPATAAPTTPAASSVPAGVPEAQPQQVDAATDALLRTKLSPPAYPSATPSYGIPLSYNLVQDPSFESGSLSGPWVPCGSPTPADVSVSSFAHTGSDSIITGAGYPEVNGYAMVCQYFGSAAPSAALSWWQYIVSSDSSAYTNAYVYDYTKGHFYAFSHTQSNTLGVSPLGWQSSVADLSPFAGHPIWIYLGVSGTGAKALRYSYIDDASIYSYTGPRGKALTGSSSGPAGFSPAGLATAYDMGVQHGWDGAGHSAGIVIDGDVSNADLATYLSQFGISRSAGFYHVPIDGTAGSDSLEPHLDVEMIASLAPSAQLILYTLPDLGDTHILNAYNQLVTNQYPEIVNSSFAGCDSGFGDQSNQLALQGAAYGMTFSASSGDGGGNGCSGEIEFPSSDPYFVSVGATSLYVKANGTYSHEVGWSGSGGGVSPHFAEPYWQQWFRSSTGRNVPDIAFNGSNLTPVSVYQQGGWWYTWGTSVSSPIFCASQAEVNQREEDLGGDVHASLYSAWINQSQYNKDWGFHDVTSGSNGPFTAGPGYDNVTGIGSADVFDLAHIE